MDVQEPVDFSVRLAYISGLAPYSPTPSSPAICRIALRARTELPASLRRGEKAAMAILPGTTDTIPPPTPVLAGRPAS